MYDEIISWADKTFPYVGTRIFSYFALQPPSLIMPPIPSGGQMVRPSINFLFLSPPGTFKSTICRIMEEMVPDFRPYRIKSRTLAKMRDDLASYKFVTLLIDDFARMSHNEELLKFLEGIMEEGEVKDGTMRDSYDFKVKVAATIMGTPKDLNGYLTSGFLGRVTPSIFEPDEDIQDAIGEHLRRGLGKYETQELKKDIMTHYSTVFAMQKDKETRVDGYVISDEFSSAVYDSWKALRGRISSIESEHYRRGGKETYFSKSTSWFREFGEAARFICASAMLHRPDRKTEENKKIGRLLVPNREDIQRGTQLMRMGMVSKYYLYRKIGAKHPDETSSMSLSEFTEEYREE